MTWSIVGSFVVGFATALVVVGVLYLVLKWKKAPGV
jgi:hypothetical protein